MPESHNRHNSTRQAKTFTDDIAVAFNKPNGSNITTNSPYSTMANPQPAEGPKGNSRSAHRKRNAGWRHQDTTSLTQTSHPEPKGHPRIHDQKQKMVIKIPGGRAVGKMQKERKLMVGFDPINGGGRGSRGVHNRVRPPYPSNDTAPSSSKNHRSPHTRGESSNHDLHRRPINSIRRENQLSSSIPRTWIERNPKKAFRSILKVQPRRPETAITDEKLDKGKQKATNINSSRRVHWQDEQCKDPIPLLTLSPPSDDEPFKLEGSPNANILDTCTTFPGWGQHQRRDLEKPRNTGEYQGYLLGENQTHHEYPWWQDSWPRFLATEFGVPAQQKILIRENSMTGTDMLIHDVEMVDGEQIFEGKSQMHRMQDSTVQEDKSKPIVSPHDDVQMGEGTSVVNSVSFRTLTQPSLDNASVVVPLPQEPTRGPPVTHAPPATQVAQQLPHAKQANEPLSSRLTTVNASPIGNKTLTMPGQPLTWSLQPVRSTTSGIVQQQPKPQLQSQPPPPTVWVPPQQKAVPLCPNMVAALNFWSTMSAKVRGQEKLNQPVPPKPSQPPLQPKSVFPLPSLPNGRPLAQTFPDDAPTPPRYGCLRVPRRKKTRCFDPFQIGSGIRPLAPSSAIEGETHVRGSEANLIYRLALEKRLEAHSKQRAAKKMAKEQAKAHSSCGGTSDTPGNAKLDEQQPLVPIDKSAMAAPLTATVHPQTVAPSQEKVESTRRDIVDLIVDSLVESIEVGIKERTSPYRPTYPPSVRLQELKQCALISKAFTFPVQKYLFSELTIRYHQRPFPAYIPKEEMMSPVPAPMPNPNSLRIIHNLYDVLKQKPYLALYMCFQVLNASEVFGHMLKVCKPLSDIFDILQRHRNPRKIELFGGLGSSHPKAMLPDFSLQEGVASYLQHLKCRSIHNMPLAFISNNPHLRSLELQFCLPAEITSEYLVSQLPSTRPRLKHLSIGGSWALLEALLGGDRNSRSARVPSVDFSALESLHLIPSECSEDVVSVQNLISNCASLKSIKMETFISVEPQTDIRPLDLSSCLTLQCLQLNMKINSTWTNDDTRSQLADTLSTIPSPNVIEHLVIDVYVKISDIVRSQSYADEGWNSLAKQLYRVCSESLSTKVHCTLKLQFFRHHLDRDRESYDLVIQECSQLAEELKTVHFHHTDSNDRVVFDITHSLASSCLIVCLNIDKTQCSNIFTMSSTFLIQEIVDLIVDSLVESIEAGLKERTSGPYRPTYPPSVRLQELKQCALINKVFTRPAQKYIFSEFSIHYYQRPSPGYIPKEEMMSPVAAPMPDSNNLRIINNLLDALLQKPYLALYMCSLDTGPAFGHMLEVCKPLSDVFDILQTHRNPRKIDFFGGMEYDLPKSILPNFRFQERVASYLEHLKCSSLGAVPLALISNGPQLQSLELRFCSLATENDSECWVSQSTSDARPKLKRLTIGDSTTLLEALLGEPKNLQTRTGPVDFSALEYLDLIPSACPEDVASVQRLISICAPSLRVITMNTLISEAETYIRPLNLSSCSRLQTLELIATINNIWTNDDSRSQLADTLSTIPSPNVIEHLVIDVYVKISDTVRSQSYADEGWNSLAKQIYRVCSESLSTKVHCTLKLQFFRFHLNRGEESYDLVTQECSQLAEELKTVHFHQTISNDRVVFDITHSLFVDHLYEFKPRM
ncbi:hypothetical protein CVT24_012019 [Panaeolus cyanescens]|uniref:Uncharacterized protein n=1 Tax=Panaeolus cyanescens TaxID=181874 RepID=A0A409YNE4_9AGAR|nr:hypothetical protein CVT24_012019 [Panaeolus cyanescens]